jgi:hypothetical protein
MTRHRITVAAATLIALGVASLGAEEAEEPGTRRVVANEEYAKGGFYEFLFGHNYRDLWTTPVVLPVLDLATFEGGLAPVRRVGHGQTQALALEGRDGREWTFRPVVKDPVGLLPEELRQSVAADFIRDQMSSQHPAGHMIVPRLLDAVGIIHNNPRLVVMADDAALGEFRAAFGGVVGDIEEYQGQPGFGGALEIVEGEEMWRKLDASADDRVDARVYLTVRLIDHLVGDWDRHRGQWHFARLPGHAAWQPFSEDRDQAFVRFEGAVLTFVRPALPLLVDFGPEYADLEGQLFDNWDVDRRLLSGLDAAAWDEVATSVQERLTDEVLEEAAHRMPPEYFAKDGPRMIAALKARRDALVQHARRYYRFLAREVDVRGTNAPDRAELVHGAGGRLEVRLFRAAGDAAPYYDRVFRPEETKEIRLDLLGGDDVASVTGSEARITVRIVTGEGNDLVDDSASGHARVAASDPGDRVKRGAHTSWDRKPYHPPAVPTYAPWIPPRDWGRRTLFPMFRLGGSTDYGLVLNLGLSSTGYGFRKLPWADQQTARVAYSTKLQRFRFEYAGLYRHENSKLTSGLDVRASGIEVIRFYGFGNETPDPGDSQETQVEQREIVVMPSLRREVGKAGELSIAAVGKLVNTTRIDGSVLDQVNPYGVEQTGEVGLVSSLAFDTTDRVGLPTRGFRAHVAGAVYPAIWDVRSTFGEVEGEITAFTSALDAPLAPRLTVRLGGKQVFGDYPFYEAAFVGGPGSVRGLDRQRYAGDAALWGGAEVHVRLSRFSSLAPGQVGLVGLVDFGRVFLEGESSHTWHHGVGGGVYIASPKGSNALGILVVRSEDRTRFYLRAGLMF